jgi:hypothetical protein
MGYNGRRTITSSCILRLIRQDPDLNRQSSYCGDFFSVSGHQGGRLFGLQRLSGPLPVPVDEGLGALPINEIRKFPGTNRAIRTYHSDMSLSPVGYARMSADELRREVLRDPCLERSSIGHGLFKHDSAKAWPVRFGGTAAESCQGEARIASCSTGCCRIASARCRRFLTRLARLRPHRLGQLKTRRGVATE